MKSLRYYSNDLNTHPIDYVEQQQGFGPFDVAYGPWEFQDPSQSVNLGYSGSNAVMLAPDVTTYHDLFTDPTTDNINQILAAKAAEHHSTTTGGWLGDLLNGMGHGMIGGSDGA